MIRRDKCISHLQTKKTFSTDKVDGPQEIAPLHITRDRLGHQESEAQSQSISCPGSSSGQQKSRVGDLHRVKSGMRENPIFGFLPLAGCTCMWVGEGLPRIKPHIPAQNSCWVAATPVLAILIAPFLPDDNASQVAQRGPFRGAW